MKITAIVKYPNPHLTPILYRLSDIKDVRLQIYFLFNVNEHKPGYDWNEPKDNKYIKIDKWRPLFKSIKNSEAVIFHGIWVHPKIYFVYLIAATLLRKRIFVLSESNNQYSIHKLKIVLRILSLKLCYKKRTYLLTLGSYEDTSNDYQKVGFRKESIFQFGYCGLFYKSSEISDSNSYKERENLRFLYVGQLIHRKGVDILLNALKKIYSADFSLRICGDGPERKSLEKLAKELCIDHKVSFRGQLNKEELIKEYKEADLLILPSRFDGWGAVLNEAAYHSVPLIAAKGVRGARELITTFKNGFIFDNENELGDMLNFICSHKGILPEMRTNSFRIASDYAPEKLAAKLHDIIHKNVIRS